MLKKKWKKEKNGKYISYIKVLTKEIMLTKTINNYNTKKKPHTFSDESKHARINNQERERREQTSIKYKYYQCVFFSPTNFI